MNVASAARELLPRHKLDFERANALAAYTFDALEPIIPELIDWQVDANWPIASTVAKAFFNLGQRIVEPLAKFLSGPDSAGKYFVLHFASDFARPDVANGLKPILENLVAFPTKADIEEEVDLAAMEALDRFECAFPQGENKIVACDGTHTDGHGIRADGSQIRAILSDEDTGGKLWLLECIVSPCTSSERFSYGPRRDAAHRLIFNVDKGDVQFAVDGRTPDFPYHPFPYLRVPAGVTHGFANRSPNDARLLIAVVPATAGSSGRTLLSKASFHGQE